MKALIVWAEQSTGDNTGLVGGWGGDPEILTLSIPSEMDEFGLSMN